jgi:hypothetical protein
VHSTAACELSGNPAALVQRQAATRWQCSSDGGDSERRRRKRTVKLYSTQTQADGGSMKWRAGAVSSGRGAALGRRPAWRLSRQGGELRQKLAVARTPNTCAQRREGSEDGRRCSGVSNRAAIMRGARAPLTGRVDSEAAGWGARRCAARHRGRRRGELQAAISLKGNNDVAALISAWGWRWRRPARRKAALRLALAGGFAAFDGRRGGVGRRQRRASAERRRLTILGEATPDRRFMPGAWHHVTWVATQRAQPVEGGGRQRDWHAGPCERIFQILNKSWDWFSSQENR